MKTFKIYTLGCKANQYDSQAIREQIEHIGFKEMTNGKKADYYVINSCTVTNKADRDSRYFIRRAIRENSKAKIVVTGCYAHSNAEEIKRIKGVSLVLNNIDKEMVASYLFRRKLSKVPFEISDFKGRTRAFVKVQDGCNNFCSFCKVPYVRGRSRSRDFHSIIEEVKRLSNKGYKEIVLTGICLGDYGKDSDAKVDLVDLIEGIEKIKGILRIRLSSIEAKDVTDRLIEKMKTSPKLCPHLHIPFQSGDNEILKLMNRRDTRESYLALIKKLKKQVRNISITTDIMVGFPGEDDKKFQNTVDFLKRIIPARVHIFTFNSRENTPFSNMQNSISGKVLKQRFTILNSLAKKLSKDFRNQFLNQTFKVLFEEKDKNVWQGYSENYLLVALRSKQSIKNRLFQVKISEINDFCLSGNLEK